MNEYFWLLCGLWCGLGGSLYARLQLKKSVDSGELSEDEVSAFVKGMAFWVFAPCLVFWVLQLSISGATQPDYMTWPSPQKYIAIILQIFVWGVLAWWILFRDGANTLSKFSAGFFSGPEFIRSPNAFRLYAIVTLLSGSYALFGSHT